MDLLPGDLILVRGKDWIEKEIEEVTHSTYSHVAGVVNSSTLIEAQGGRRVGYQSVIAYKGESDVYRYDDLYSWERRILVKYANKQLGRRYSYFLVLWEWFRYRFHVFLPFLEKDPIICSTLWAVDVYRKAGLDICPGIRYPTPADIANSRYLKKVGSF